MGVLYEAIFGFAGWLTSQDKPIVASSRHDAAIWAKAVEMFCLTNNLDEPRDGWAKNLKHPNQTLHVDRESDADLDE